MMADRTRVPSKARCVYCGLPGGPPNHVYGERKCCPDCHHESTFDSRYEAAAAAIHDERGRLHRAAVWPGHDPGWCPYCYLLAVLAIDAADDFDRKRVPATESSDGE